MFAQVYVLTKNEREAILQLESQSKEESEQERAGSDVNNINEPGNEQIMKFMCQTN